MARAVAAVLLSLALGSSACGGAELVPPRQGLAMRDVEFPIRQLTFPSGLRVLLERDDRAPVVGLFLVVGAGSTADPPGKEGLAHYVEHLAFRSRPFGKSNVSHLLETSGASQWNASTDLDATVFWEIAPKSALPELLRLQGARMTNPVAQVPAETAAVELEVVRNELRQRNETGASGEVLGAMQAAVFPPKHPYARPVIGTHTSLSSIAPADVAAFVDAHYRPDRMTLLVLGDIDLATAGALVEKTLPPTLLGAHPAGAAPPAMAAVAPEPPAPPAGDALRRMEAAVATPEIWIGWSLPRAFDADGYVMEFVADAAEAALAHAEREDPDIAFVTVRLVPGKDASMLLCRVGLTTGAHAERSRDHVLDALYLAWGGAARSPQVQQIEFTARKRRAVVGILLEAEDLLTRGVERVTSTHFSRNPSLYARSISRVGTLESTRVTGYAERYLTRSRARTVVFTPPAGGGALPDAASVGAAALDDEPLSPIHVDAARLAATFPAPSSAQVREMVLSNGLTMLVARRPGLPTVSVALGIRGGTRSGTDPAAATLGFLLARPRDHAHGDAGDFGGRFRRGSRSDALTYRLDGAAGNAPIMLAILAERVASLEVDSGIWQPFERDVLPYLRAAEQKPETDAERRFLATLFGPQGWGRSATAKDLEASSARAAQAWIAAVHVPRNAVLAVVGEIDPSVVEAAEQTLGRWSGSGDPEPTPPPITPFADAAPRPELSVTQRVGASQAQIRFGCLLPSAAKSVADVHHDLDAQILSDRIGARLRKQLGVSYGLLASARVLRGGTAYLDLRGAVDAGKLAPSLGVLKEALDTLASTPLDERELAWAKLRTARGKTLRYTTNAGVASDLLDRALMGWGVASLDTFASDLAAATADDVAADFKACAAGRPTLSVVGDESVALAAFAATWR